MVMSGLSVNQTTLFTGRLRPPTRLNEYSLPGADKSLLKSVERGKDRKKYFMINFHGRMC